MRVCHRGRAAAHSAREQGCWVGVGVRCGVRFKPDTTTDTRADTGRDTEPGSVSSAPSRSGRRIPPGSQGIGLHGLGTLGGLVMVEETRCARGRPPALGHRRPARPAGCENGNAAGGRAGGIPARSRQAGRGPDGPKGCSVAAIQVHCGVGNQRAGHGALDGRRGAMTSRHDTQDRVRVDRAVTVGREEQGAGIA